MPTPGVAATASRHTNGRRSPATSSPPCPAGRSRAPRARRPRGMLRKHPFGRVRPASSPQATAGAVWPRRKWNHAPSAARRIQRLGVRGAIEDRERIRGEQQQRGAARASRRASRAPCARNTTRPTRTPRARSPGRTTSGVPSDDRAARRSGTRRSPPRRAYQQRIRRKERQVLLRIEAAPPLVAVSGDAGVPLRVPSRRQHPDRIPRLEGFPGRGRHANGHRRHQADDDDRGARKAERDGASRSAGRAESVPAPPIAASPGSTVAGALRDALRRLPARRTPRGSTRGDHVAAHRRRGNRRRGQERPRPRLPTPWPASAAAARRPVRRPAHRCSSNSRTRCPCQRPSATFAGQECRRAESSSSSQPPR